MDNQTKVFIAGSRHLPRLNRDVKRRISNIVDRGFTIVVGDANGADKAVQQYLNERGYRSVIVFCTEGNCRNNAGNWPTRAVPVSNPRRKDFEYYRAKDQAMVEEADFGLMLWDGQSRGTLTNIVGLVRRRRPLVVYVAPLKSFYTLRQAKDLIEMLSRCNPSSLHQIDSRLESITRENEPNRNAEMIPLF